METQTALIKYAITRHLQHLKRHYTTEPTMEHSSHVATLLRSSYTNRP